jgi:hypothetical protein
MFHTATQLPNQGIVLARDAATSVENDIDYQRELQYLLIKLAKSAVYEFRELSKLPERDRELEEFT